jgi:hypothetical protein
MSANRRINKTLVLGIKGLITLGVIGYLIHKIELSDIWDALISAQHRYILIAAALIPLNLGLQYLKWKTLAQLTVEARGKEIWLSLMGGLALGLLTPGRVGEYGRALFIQKPGWKSLVGLTLYDKFTSLVLLACIGFNSVAWFIADQKTIPAGIFILLNTLSLSILFLLLNPRILARMLYGLKGIWAKYPRVYELLCGIEHFKRWTASSVFGLAVLQITVYLSQFVLLILAFARVQLSHAYIASAATMLTKTALPIAIADLGIRESAAVFYFGQLGVSHAAAFNASLLLFSINVFIPSLVGVVMAFSSSIRSHTESSHPPGRTSR